MQNENFQKNYNSIQLREQFKLITGIDAVENPAAYIGYLNSLTVDITYGKVKELELKVKLLNQKDSEESKPV